LSASFGSLTQNANGTWTWSYLANGGTAPANVTITATDKDNGTNSVTFSLSVVNLPPTVAADHGAVSVNEGGTATNTGTFGDPGSADAVTMSASVGSITQSGGTWSWSFNTNDGPAQSQTVTITATDSHNAHTTTTFALTVNNVAPSQPTLSVTPAAPYFTGGTLTFTASGVTDPSTADTQAGFTYVWTVNTVVQTGQTGATFSLTPTTTGNYTITVAAKDKDGAVGTPASTSVTVNSNTASVAISGLPTGTIYEGSLITLTATASSGSPTYAWTLTGSGGTQTGSGSSFSFRPPVVGSYTASVTANFGGGVTATKSMSFSAVDALLTAGAGSSIVVGEALPLNNQPVATFTDGTPLGGIGDFTATINWGDNTTSAGTIALVSHGSASSTYNVMAGHTYAAAGNYTLVVMVGDVSSGGSTVTVTDNVTVQSNIVLVSSTTSGALAVSGKGQIKVTGSVQIDSNSASALQASGQGKITATQITVVGGVQISGQATTTVTPTTHAASVADPLASLPAPSPSAYGLTNKGAYNLSSGNATLNPGVYTSINVSGNSTLTLNPGIYVIAGGGFNVSGNAIIQGAGVMIYNAGSNFVNGGAAGGTFGAINVSGQGSFSVTPMTSGPYAGIVIFQSGSASQSGVNTQTITLSGQSMLPGGGMLYAPAASVQISGNSVFKGSVVASSLQVSGNAGAFQLHQGASSDYLSSTSNQILGGVLSLAVQDDVGTGLDPNEVARLNDAVAYLNESLGVFGVHLSWADSAADADVHIHFASTTPQGGATDGVLGFTTDTNDVYFVSSGWDFYTGSDASGISAGQFDFLTLATHELAHTVGLGESGDANSVMYEYLSEGMARRTFTDSNLSLINTDADRFMKVGGSLAATGMNAPATLTTPARPYALPNDMAAQLGPQLGDPSHYGQVGGGSDVLVGGSGDDILIGAGGRDLLVGGTGLARNRAARGDDLLVADGGNHQSNSTVLRGVVTPTSGNGHHAASGDGNHDGLLLNLKHSVIDHDDAGGNGTGTGN